MCPKLFTLLIPDIDDKLLLIGSSSLSFPPSLFSGNWSQIIPSQSIAYVPKQTQEMGVKTDRNGFLSEDGLVAFYRDLGHLGDDVEAAGVRARNLRGWGGGG